MSANGAGQLPQQHRSQSVELVQVENRAEIRDNRTASQYPQQQALRPVTAASGARAQHISWDPAKRYLSPLQQPPRPFVGMREVTVDQTDLTSLYSVSYPSLDFANSVAYANIPPGRHQPTAPPTPLPARAQASDDAQGSGGAVRTAAVPTDTVPPVPAVTTAAPPMPNSATSQQQTATQGPAQTAPMASAQASTATTAAQPPKYHQVARAALRSKEETHFESLQRLYGIDINDVTRYRDGNNQTLQYLGDLVAEIQAIRKNNRGFPFRRFLIDIGEHFMQKGGKLKATSFLWLWYSDTRVFTRREWYYLATDGLGDQVPWTTWTGDMVSEHSKIYGRRR